MKGPPWLKPVNDDDYFLIIPPVLHERQLSEHSYPFLCHLLHEQSSCRAWACCTPPCVTPTQEHHFGAAGGRDGCKQASRYAQDACSESGRQANCYITSLAAAGPREMCSILSYSASSTVLVSDWRVYPHWVSSLVSRTAECISMQVT